MIPRCSRAPVAAPPPPRHDGAASLLPGAPDADRACAWALTTTAGALLRRGRDRPADWPDADRREAVLAASLARIAVVTLPPLPPARVAAAAAFALEDALAGAPGTQQLVAGRQGSDGRVPVTIVARAALAPARRLRPAIRADRSPSRNSRLRRRRRAVSAAAPVWRWCQGAGDGFVRTGDGGAFAVTALGADRALPPELAQALAAAVAQGAAPTVRAEVDGAAGSTARWQQQTGATFTAAAPWQWDTVPAEHFAAARDLGEPHARASAPPIARRRGGCCVRPRSWPPPRSRCTCVATAGEWLAGTLRASRDRAAWVELARDAGRARRRRRDARCGACGAGAAPRGGAARARTAGARRCGAAAGARGAGAGDAAAGTLRRATYAGGAWTLELAPLDAAALGALDARLKAAGAPALAASSAAGVRLRIGGP